MSNERPFNHITSQALPAPHEGGSRRTGFKREREVLGNRNQGHGHPVTSALTTTLLPLPRSEAMG